MTTGGVGQHGVGQHGVGQHGVGQPVVDGLIGTTSADLEKIVHLIDQFEPNWSKFESVYAKGKRKYKIHCGNT